MISTLANPKTGYLEFIQRLIHEGDANIECLILSHNNPTLISRLDDAFADKPAVLIDLPQDQWQLHDGKLLRAIQWSVVEGGVKHVILVGDSSAAGQGHLAPSVRANPRALVAGANSIRQQAQDQFREQLLQLVKAMPELNLTGLFYRAESGVFVNYDAESDSFKLLS